MTFHLYLSYDDVKTVMKEVKAHRLPHNKTDDTFEGSKDVKAAMHKLGVTTAPIATSFGWDYSAYAFSNGEMTYLFIERL